MTNEREGSFPVGLVLGLFVGAVKYFSTDSKEAKQVQSFLQSQWEGALSTLEAQPIAKTKVSPLRAVLTELAAYVTATPDTTGVDTATRSKKMTKVQKVKKTSQLFKGV